jgi:alkylation response protein AidB-like acyl-CoA dehydrogenase
LSCSSAMAIEAGEPAQRRRFVSAAKVLASQLGRAHGLAAIQMHGALGMTDECRISHYAKRLLVIGQLFGDASWQLRRLAASTTPST